MKIVGKYKEPKITFHATAENLKWCTVFNDSMNNGFKIKLYIPKGVYHFKTHEEANQHWNKYVIKGILERQKEIKKQNGKWINSETGDN